MSLSTVVFPTADEHGVWRQRRHAELSAADGWLSLIGLHWLEEGRHSVGSAAGASVCLPDGPPCLGELEVRHGQVFWCPENFRERPLRTDRDGSPEVVESGDLAFHVIERNGRFALRVRDRAWASRNPFNGVEAYPFDPAWQVVADWVALDSPMQLEVPDVSGDLKTVEVAFRADFTLAGERYSLLPMSASEREVFFVFRDRSSGRETYGAGRFLKANPTVDGKIGLDFNRAFNPPCAFTPFATCPLPPPENWLPVAVTAGEKKWQKPA